MRITRPRNTGTVEADMTPMIDMTFQLIAFFMVLINFSEAEQDQRIRLPASELAKPPEGAFDAPLTLQLTRDSKVLVSGEEIPLAAANTVIRRERQLFERLGKDPGDVTVIIRADGNANIGDVQQLIKDCQTVGKFEKFALRATQEESSGP